jgi:hypothetical protein
MVGMSVKGCCGSHDSQPVSNIKPVSTTIHKIAIALVVIGIIGLICAAFGVSRLIMGNVGLFSQIDQLAAILMVGIGGGGALISFIVVTLLKTIEYCRDVNAKKADSIVQFQLNHPPPPPLPLQTSTSTPPPSTPQPTSTPPPPPLPLQTSTSTPPPLPLQTSTPTPPPSTPQPQASSLLPPLPFVQPQIIVSVQSPSLHAAPPLSITHTFTPLSVVSLMPTKSVTSSTTTPPVVPVAQPNAPAKKALTLKTNLPSEMMFSRTKFALHPSEIQQLKDDRADIIKGLGYFFELDEFGYIQGVKDGVNLQAISQQEEDFAKLFFNIANRGDAGYAESIRTTLLGLSIASSQVDKNNRNTKLLDPYRPVNFVNNSTRTGRNEPPNHGKKGQSAYIDLWGQAIWDGYRQYRRKTYSKPLVAKIQDTPFTPAQKAEYQRRLQRVRELHKWGWLVGRVAELEEVAAFAGHRYRMRANDILSTTLWPPTEANITLRLYSESGEAPVGILIDASRTGHDDFALGFSANAYTVGTGYAKLKSAGKSSGIDGVVTLQGQHDLYEALNGMAAQGLSVTAIKPTVSADKSSYHVPKADARSAAAPTGRGGTSASGQPKNQLPHNEQTFYRGAEREIFLSFFVKSDSDDMPSALRRIVLQQDRLRRGKGIYVPIFQFKGDSNQLEEIVADELVILLLGLKDQVTHHPEAKSRLSQALTDASITNAIAAQAALSVKNARYQGGFLYSLFDIQLLMYNMRNLGGSLSVLEKQGQHHVYKQIRLLDNLHLVFPTIHKTKNTTSERQNYVLSKGDLQNLRRDTFLLQFFQLSIRNNLKRFLGIQVDGKGTVTFEKKVLKMFDSKDSKRTDFAQVLSRAMQAAVLFDVFSQDVVSHIVESIRKDLPYLGVTPANSDMILGSCDMQEILTFRNLNPFTLHKSYRPQQLLTGQPLPFPTRPLTLKQLETVNIFEDSNKFRSVLGSVAAEIGNYLQELGIKVLDTNGNVKIDSTVIDRFRSAEDEHLIKYEAEVMQVITIATMLNPGAASNILTGIRVAYPSFGLSAAGREAHNAQEKRLGWIAQKLQGSPPSAEFPFKDTKVAENKEENEWEGVPIGVLRNLVIRGGHLPPTGGMLSTTVAKVSPAPEKQLMMQNREQLRKHLPAHLASLIPSYVPNSNQARVARNLGLINAQGERLWEVEPRFHEGNQGKPVAPYLEFEDMMGENAVELCTGPGFQRATLRADQATFQCDWDMNILSRCYESTNALTPAAIQERLLTYTLAVTVDGDTQVLRTNGYHYSTAGAEPPVGGNIKYNPRNERSRFRNDSQRTYLKPLYTGFGGYTREELDEVKSYDAGLLSDRERRAKRVGCLPSAYVTVTASGAGEGRISLDRGYKVLLVNTAGPQFEKYDSPSYTNVGDPTPQKSELEVADFIIKSNALRVKQPLFPEYYPGGQIPAHGEIDPQHVASSIGFEYDKPYVRLSDGAYFNRAAYQEASNRYLKWVVPITVTRTRGAAYIKVTLFGGGFFADTKKAGNLRQEVIYSMVTSWTELLKKNLVPTGSVLEFPRYGALDSLPPTLVRELRHYAKQNGVSIVWSVNGDMHDFGEQKDVEGKIVNPVAFEERSALVIFNAADVMSWAGNEKSSASVDSINGNNSNMRLVMNWWANPYVLDTLGTASTSGVSIHPTNRILSYLQKNNPSNPIYRQRYQHIRGPAESAITFPGYDTPKLQQIEDHLTTREIPLHVCPARPGRSYPMDQAKADQYVSSLDSQYQPLAKKALAHTQHISMTKFDGALKQCVDTLNQQLKTPYSVGITFGKSMQWVASLALKDLGRLPDSWFPLSSEQGTMFVQTLESKLDISHVTEGTLVIFDDCSYSGTQLYGNLCRLEEAVNKGNFPKQLYIVIPFMSQAAQDQFKNFQAIARPTLSLLQVTLITGSEKIHCIKDIFNQNERDQISTFFNSVYFSSMHKHLNHPGTTSLAWTDWRMPDARSFEKGFGNVGMLKRNAQGFYLDTLSEDEYFIPVKIPRPYQIT